LQSRIIQSTSVWIPASFYFHKLTNTTNIHILSETY